jgi:hypothetical protein
MANGGYEQVYVKFGGGAGDFYVPIFQQLRMKFTEDAGCNTISDNVSGASGYETRVVRLHYRISP